MATDEPKAADPYADPAAFWAAQGEGMTAPWDPVRDATPDQRRQEGTLSTMLGDQRRKFVTDYGANGPIQWPNRIFEAGCGRGRLAAFFARNCPEASYTAIDVGDIQLAETAKLRPDAKLLKANITKVDVLDQIAAADPEAHKAGGYDLVVVSEVLMHVRPGQDLTMAYFNLLELMSDKLSRLVIIEWVPLPGEVEANPTAYWNFPHNYPALIKLAEAGLDLERRTDRQMIYFVRPDR